MDGDTVGDGCGDIEGDKHVDKDGKYAFCKYRLILDAMWKICGSGFWALGIGNWGGDGILPWREYGIQAL